MFNLAKAVTIVFVVLLFAMGRKTGFIIGMVLFLTIMATFLVMYMKGDLLMERISLGALIIALCMLTDNAIIVIEGIKVGIEAGEDKLQVVREVVAQNQWPLFGATAIGVIAFAAIGLSEDQHRRVLQLAVLGHPDFPEPELGVVDHRHAAAELPVFQADRRAELPEAAIRTRACSSGSTATFWSWHSASAGRWWSSRSCCSSRRCTASRRSIRAFSRPRPGRNSWWMSSCRPAPISANRRRSPSNVQQYIQAQPGVTHVTSFIGGGGLRFLLVYSPEKENRAFVQFLVDVDDPKKIDGLIADIQKHLDEQHPERQRRRQEVPAGPGQGGRIQARFRGPDPGEAARTRRSGEAGPRRRRRGRVRAQRLARARKGDPPRPARTPGTPQRHHARRGGPGAGKPALKAAWSASTASRAAPAPESIPQETRLLPIVARPPLTERDDVHAINSLQIWSPVAGRMIPLSQVTSGAEVVWEDPVVMRRDRFPTHHRPRRPAVRFAQPAVQPRAVEDRADRAAAGLFARMGRRVRGLPRRPRRPGQAAPLRAGAHGVHRRVPVQLDPHHAPDLADHAAGDHRRDGRAAAHGQAVRLHGPARRAQPGRRADQESDRRPEQDPHRDRQGEGALSGDPGRGHQQDAAGVHGRLHDRPRA